MGSSNLRNSQYKLKEKVIALVDCNSFFASCEVAFDPQLKGKPVGVLSNNDGIIVARSPELKHLPLNAGRPVFEIRHILEENNVILRSSNYTLYQDMSRRVMQTLKQFTPNIEIYSIDEAFLDLTDLHITDYEAFGKEIKKIVYEWTGLPVSVGIAPTKTLAKAANELGKTNKDFEGVVDLYHKAEHEIDELLASLPVKDVWGVGYAYTKKLKAWGVRNAMQLKYLHRSAVKKHMTVVSERMLLELNGISCFPVHNIKSARQSLLTSRMFGKRVESVNDIKESVANYAAISAEKLRKEGSIAKGVYVWITTGRHAENRYSNGFKVVLPEPTDNTQEMIKVAKDAVDQIYLPGYKYKKAGVCLFNIQPKGTKQINMFYPPDSEKEKKVDSVLDTIDLINKQQGRHVMKFGSQGTKSRKEWWMKRLQHSPRYTTQWSELPVAHAK